VAAGIGSVPMREALHRLQARAGASTRSELADTFVLRADG